MLLPMVIRGVPSAFELFAQRIFDRVLQYSYPTRTKAFATSTRIILTSTPYFPSFDPLSLSPVDLIWSIAFLPFCSQPDQCTVHRLNLHRPLPLLTHPSRNSFWLRGQRKGEWLTDLSDATALIRLR